MNLMSLALKCTLMVQGIWMGLDPSKTYNEIYNVCFSVGHIMVQKIDSEDWNAVLSAFEELPQLYTYPLIFLKAPRDSQTATFQK